MANRVRDVTKTVRRDYSKDDIKSERIERYHQELKEATERLQKTFQRIVD